MHPLETYLRHLTEIRSTGAGAKETSYYPALANLFNEIGKKLKPKVHCVMTLKNQGAGMPDGGLFTPDQFQKGDAEPLAGQPPSRGAIECKSTKDVAFVTAVGPQVSKYGAKYRQVLVTNYRDFVLVTQDPDGKPVKGETLRLAPDEKTFWQLAAHPKKLASEQGERFVDFLRRVFLNPVPLADPKDVAWFLAGHAREGSVGWQIPHLSLELLGGRVVLGSPASAISWGITRDRQEPLKILSRALDVLSQECRRSEHGIEVRMLGCL